MPAIWAVCHGLMLVMAAIDARTRRLPNALALAFAAACAVAAGAGGGVGELKGHLEAACATCSLLVAFELVWRRLHGGAPGLGMGDVKYLFGAMLLDPVRGLLSFVGGLMLLAVFGALTRRGSLPVLPFAVGVYEALALAGL